MVPSVLFEQKIEKINLNGEEYSDNTIFKVFKSEMMKFQVLKPKYSKFHVFSRPGDKIMKFHVFSRFPEFQVKVGTLLIVISQH
jgi:hypothetical protein